jgi:hypothetical protein
MENTYGAKKQKISTNFYFLNIPHIRGILEKKYKMVFDTHIGGGKPQPKVEDDDDEPSVDDYMRMKAENKDLKQQIFQLTEALNKLQTVEVVPQNMFLEQEKKPRKKATIVNEEVEAEDIVVDETVENIDDAIANLCIFSKK